MAFIKAVDLEVTEADLDAAIAASKGAEGSKSKTQWCVLSQAGKRQFPDLVVETGVDDFAIYTKNDEPVAWFMLDFLGKEVVNLFDFERYNALRAMLPVKIHLEKD